MFRISIIICVLFMLVSHSLALEIKPAVDIDRAEVEQLKNTLMYYQSGNEGPPIRKFILDKTVITIYYAPKQQLIRHAFIPLSALNYSKTMTTCGLTKNGRACDSNEPAFSLASISPLEKIVDRLTMESPKGNFFIDLSFPYVATFFTPNPNDKFTIKLIPQKCSGDKNPIVFVLGDMHYTDNRLIDDVSPEDRKLLYDFWQIKP